MRLFHVYQIVRPATPYLFIKQIHTFTRNILFEQRRFGLGLPQPLSSQTLDDENEDILVQIQEEQRQFPRRFAQRLLQGGKRVPFPYLKKPHGRNVVEIVFVLPVFVIKYLVKRVDLLDDYDFPERTITETPIFCYFLSDPVSHSQINNEKRVGSY